MKETGIKESVMITLDEEHEIRQDEFQINIVPAWKYFLSNMGTGVVGQDK